MTYYAIATSVVTNARGIQVYMPLKCFMSTGYLSLVLTLAIYSSTLWVLTSFVDGKYWIKLYSVVVTMGVLFSIEFHKRYYK